jgi:type IV pilus assembly protein PilF
MTISRALILIFALLLAGCASNKAERAAEAESNRKAAETNVALGRQYMERGQIEVALEKLKRAIAQDTTYAPAHTMLGILYETIGQTEMAGKEYATAVRYDPTDGDVNNNYGAFLCATGRAGEADAYFLKAVEDPFYDTPEIAYANAGSCALQRNDLDKAERYLRQSLGYNQELGTALLPMADVSYRQGSYLRARGFLQRYEAVGDLTEESLYLGFLIESKLGDDSAAGRYRIDLIEQFPNSAQANQL